MEQRRFVGGGEGFADLGAVHVALRGERGEVWRVVVEAGCAQGAASAHLGELVETKWDISGKNNWNLWLLCKSTCLLSEQSCIS